MNWISKRFTLIAFFLIFLWQYLCFMRKKKLNEPYQLLSLKLNNLSSLKHLLLFLFFVLKSGEEMRFKFSYHPGNSGNSLSCSSIDDFLFCLFILYLFCVFFKVFSYLTLTYRTFWRISTQRIFFFFYCMDDFILTKNVRILQIEAFLPVRHSLFIFLLNVYEIYTWR